QMPYIFLKGDIGFGAQYYSSVYMEEDEAYVRQPLGIPDHQEARDGAYVVRMLAGSVLNILELQGWRVVAVNGPDPNDGFYIWTLHKDAPLVDVTD
ncbi:hypothetical protein PMAYCL1PPCAC_19788, partial [Pristionchus mayeri]